MQSRPPRPGGTLLAAVYAAMEEGEQRRVATSIDGASPDRNAVCIRLLARWEAAERVEVLLVEDSEADALYVKFLLENPMLCAAYSLSWIPALEDLEEALSACRPQVVLVDLGLPGCDGLDACAQTVTATREAAVLVLTGKYDEDLAIACVSRGAQDYLLKDELDGLCLERAIRYAIERHRYASRRRRSL